jgi:hypothetical protein
MINLLDLGDIENLGIVSRFENLKTEKKYMGACHFKKFVLEVSDSSINLANNDVIRDR